MLGAIPFAYIASRLKKGIDIRQVGGGNVGALNTLREIGLLPGLGVLIADMAKGALAVLVAIWLNVPLVWIFVVGFAAIVGHIWPVFLKFKGGKGAATTLGVMLALMPIEAGISIGIVALVIIITSNMRLAVTIALVFLPIIIWRLDGSLMLISYSIAITIFLLIISFAGIRQATTDSRQKKNLIFDRDYHFWQAKKKA